MRQCKYNIFRDVIKITQYVKYSMIYDEIMVMYVTDLINEITDRKNKNKCIIEEKFKFESFPKTWLPRDVLLVLLVAYSVNDGFYEYCTLFVDYGQLN